MIYRGAQLQLTEWNARKQGHGGGSGGWGWHILARAAVDQSQWPQWWARRHPWRQNSPCCRSCTPAGYCSTTWTWSLGLGGKLALRTSVHCGQAAVLSIVGASCSNSLSVDMPSFIILGVMTPGMTRTVCSQAWCNSPPPHRWLHDWWHCWWPCQPRVWNASGCATPRKWLKVDTWSQLHQIGLVHRGQ